MLARILFLTTCTIYFHFYGYSQAEKKLSINGFTHWLTGRDSATAQLIPMIGSSALTRSDDGVVAHVKFKVSKYGELSFPLQPSDASEALRVNLDKSRFIKIEYKANHEVILQLRETGVHGGVHNHITLPASDDFVQRTIYFTSFTGGLKALDLSNVAKFNFAFLANNIKDGYAELMVRSFRIHRYKP